MKPRGFVYIVGAGPGDPDLITMKGLACLKRADVILHDRLIHPRLLAHARNDALVVDVGKRAGAEDQQQLEIHQLMISNADQGKVVCRLQGGDPLIFGRAGEEIAALSAAGIAFEVIPGVSSITAAATAAGISLTHREHTHGFVVIAGSRSINFESAEWRTARTLLQTGGTVVILMSLTRLESIVGNLLGNGCSPDLPAAVISRASWDDQEVRWGTAQNIAEKSTGLRTPALLMLGNVVTLQTSHSEKHKPPEGRR